METNLKELLVYIVSELVDDKEAIDVREVTAEDSESVTLELRVAKEDMGKAKAKLDETIARVNAEIAEAKKRIPPEIQNLWDSVWGRIDAEFKRVHGLTIEELVQKAAEKSEQPLFEIDPDSPIFKMENDLKTQIETMRQETVAHIKKVVPPVNVA